MIGDILRHRPNLQQRGAREVFHGHHNVADVGGVLRDEPVIEIVQRGTELRRAGKLDGVRGIVFGEMLDCESPGAPPNLLEDTIMSALSGLEIPITIGLRSGHVSRQNVTLIFGIEAELHGARVDGES